MDIFIAKTVNDALAPITAAVKDCLDVKGFPTTCGSAALADSAPATEDADVVKHLKKAGVTLVGKTNLHELAYGMTGVNSHFGTPVNPMYPLLITGGSSSGSAAVVAGADVTFSVGTDTGGSIRVPAACCGIAGFKPTYDRISRNGAKPAFSTLDAIGPMARNIQDLELGMSAMDPTFEANQPMPTDIRIGRLSVSGTQENNQAIDVLLDRFTAATDATVTEVTELALFKPAFDAAMTIMNAEVWDSFKGLDFAKLGSDVATRLQNAASIDTQAVSEAEQVRTAFNKELDSLFSEIDMLVLPTLPALPMQRKAALAGETDLKISLFTRPFNLSGHPALVMPLSSAQINPLSIQLVTRKNEDELLFAVARRMWEIEHSDQPGIGE